MGHRRRRRASRRHHHQDVPVPGVLHSVALDGADAQSRRPSAGQQAELQAPRRPPADIVVFERPSTDVQTVEGCDGQPVTITPPKNVEAVHDLIKRVVAVGGETVESRAGHVFVNGQPLAEPYLAANVLTPAFDTFSSPCIRVPKGDVFVLGDNRTNSSASNKFGPDPREPDRRPRLRARLAARLNRRNLNEQRARRLPSCDRRDRSRRRRCPSREGCRARARTARPIRTSAR